MLGGSLPYGTDLGFGEMIRDVVAIDKAVFVVVPDLPRVRGVVESPYPLPYPDGAVLVPV